MTFIKQEKLQNILVKSIKTKEKFKKVNKINLL